MYHRTFNPLRQPWFALGLIGLSLLVPVSVRAGSAPSGGGSGVTTTGSVPLSIGGAPITGEVTTSNSANVSLDPTTGALLLTAEAQASVNSTANQLRQQLGERFSGLVGALGHSISAELDRPVEHVALAIRGVNDGAPVTQASLRQAASMTDSAIEAGRWVTLFTEQETLAFSAPLVVVDSPGQFSTTATYSPTADAVSTSALTLQGSPEQLGNASAFLVVAVGAGTSPDEVAAFADLALAGVPYEQLVELLNAVGGLLAITADDENIDPDQLNQAIHAYNAIITSVDDATLVNLLSNAEFMALGQALRELRQAIDT